MLKLFAFKLVAGTNNWCWQKWNFHKKDNYCFSRFALFKDCKRVSTLNVFAIWIFMWTLSWKCGYSRCLIYCLTIFWPLAARLLNCMISFLILVLFIFSLLKFWFVQKSRPKEESFCPYHKNIAGKKYWQKVERSFSMFANDFSC